MNARRLTAVIAAACLVLSIVPAEAAHARQIQVVSGTKLGGTELPAGAFTLRWKQNGSDAVEVTITKGATVLARATGSLQVRDAVHPSDSVAYQSDGNGGREIAEIRFAGKREVIVLRG